MMMPFAAVYESPVGTKRTFRLPRWMSAFAGKAEHDIPYEQKCFSGRTVMNANVERTTIRKVYLRLLPLLFVSYFVCYLDRINVGFAALTMNKDLGFTATVFALGATAFFWGYCLFEIPSNIVLEKIGARVWIARIMITWGLFSCATAFVTGAISFATIRFFLGVCEAGFFPGMNSTSPIGSRRAIADGWSGGS